MVVSCLPDSSMVQNGLISEMMGTVGKVRSFHSVDGIIAPYCWHSSLIRMYHMIYDCGERFITCNGVVAEYKQDVQQRIYH